VLRHDTPTVVAERPPIRFGLARSPARVMIAARPIPGGLSSLR